MVTPSSRSSARWTCRVIYCVGEVIYIPTSLKHYWADVWCWFVHRDPPRNWRESSIVAPGQKAPEQSDTTSWLRIQTRDPDTGPRQREDWWTLDQSHTAAARHSAKKPERAATSCHSSVSFKHFTKFTSIPTPPLRWIEKKEHLQMQSDNHALCKWNLSNRIVAIGTLCLVSVLYKPLSAFTAHPCRHKTLYQRKTNLDSTSWVSWDCWFDSDGWSADYSGHIRCHTSHYLSLRSHRAITDSPGNDNPHSLRIIDNVYSADQ